MSVDTAGNSPIFIVGSGRSGTTWLQTLLTHHPQIASAPETDLFAGYLSLMEERWNAETKYRDDYGRKSGLQGLISEESFYDSFSTLIGSIFDAIRACKTGSTAVLEKTPHNVFYAPLILRYFPDARFIHLVRDPRSVVASLRAAADSWGNYWAERGAIAGATRWLEHVSTGLAIAGKTSHYYQVTYEALRQDTANELKCIFDWLQIPIDASQCAIYAEASSITEMRKIDSTTANMLPTNNVAEFVRSGKAEGWRSELTTIDIAAIEAVCGKLMEQLGYELASKRPGRNRSFAIFAARSVSFLRRIVLGIHWRLDRYLSGLERAL